MAETDSGPKGVVVGVVSLQAGRSLCFAPEWDCSDAAVLFDRNSGDYWVISSLAAQVLKSMQDQPDGSLTLQELERLLKIFEPAADLEPTLQSLADNSLVRFASKPLRTTATMVSSAD